MYFCMCKQSSKKNSALFSILSNVLMCAACGSNEVAKFTYFLKQCVLTFVCLFLNLVSAAVVDIS